MRIPAPETDFRQFQPQKLRTDEFRHLLLLLYWPAYGLMFLFVNWFYHPEAYHVVHCALDDRIPFCEFFLVAYLLWFVELTAMTLYALLYDVDTFRRYMKFIILTYSIALIAYIAFPTCQQLRPAAFARDNLFTRFVAGLYRLDPSNNVCPSTHVIGALAVLFAAWRTPRRRGLAGRVCSLVVTILVCVSTVFLKQHSVLDVLAALPIALIGYFTCFHK